uniref:Endoglucanase n=1 Tax=Fagus sylvatica TaxID=28930 RepID=A0A2N9ECI8_FAGSY
MASATTFTMIIMCLTLCYLSLFCCAFTSQDYSQALEKSILFFEGQRSGKLPSNQRLTWRADSGLSDGSSDHVGNPNMDHQCWERPEDMDTPRNVYKVSDQNPGSDVAAETAAALAAASIVFKDSDPSYSAKLLHTAMKVFDFADRHRGSYSDSLNSVVCPFYCSYSGYHDELLWGASWIHRASQNSSYLAYIQSNGHTLGADDDDYSFSWDDKRAGTKVLLSKGFLERTTQEFQIYKAHSDNYICSLIPGTSSSNSRTSSFQAHIYPCSFVQTTITSLYTTQEMHPNGKHNCLILEFIGGLLYKASESNLQYVTSTAFLLLTYAKYLSSNGGVATCGSSKVTAQNLISQAKKQVDYILGDNPAKMSYMVGFGQRYPQHVHHRGSSLPSVHAHPDHIACNNGFQYLYSSSPNPNVLAGAIVGGPDNKDNFSDDRNNYQQAEPATYINAPFVGAVAFFSANPTTK